MVAESPLVTVIIATYNRRHYICDAIESVLHQTYSNIEAVVIDDGSTDATGDLLREKYGERIRYVYQENKGRSEARNQGMLLARGKYIAFLDSDDLWKPHKLSRQIAFMEQDPKYGLTHTFTEIIDEAGQDSKSETTVRLRWHQQAYKRGYSYEAMSHRCIMFLSTVIFRANMIQQIGFMDRDIPAFEDWDWYLRAALVVKIGTLPEPLTCYRRHIGNSTSAEFLVGERTTSMKHIELCDALPAKLKYRAKRNFYLHLAAVAYKEENPEECATFLREASALDPWALLRVENLRYTLAAYGPKKLIHRLRRIRRSVTA